MTARSVVRFCAGLALTLALVAAGATTALAHATLLSTSPGNGAVLAAPPRHVVLQFDVPVNPRLSVAVLEDDRGRVVSGAAIDAGSGASSTLTVDLPGLPNGAYRLVFHARDDTDLHETEGAIVFGVAEAIDVQGLPVTSPSPSYLETGARWLELAGACLLVGLAVVWLGILPALAQRRAVAGGHRAKLLGLAVLGYSAIVLGKVGQIVVVAWGLARGGVADLPNALWWVLSTSQFGLLWLAGMALALLTLVAVRAALARPGSRPAAAALVAATVALLAVASSTSHGDSRDGIDPLQVAVRTVHLGGAGLWVGGLTVLVFLFAGALRGASPETPVALAAFRRFTGLAFLAVGLLTASGLLLAARGVASPAALVMTPYGLTLVAKMIAGAAALGFGVRHTLLLNPPRGAGVGGPVRVARMVPFEVGAMLVVLWAAAALGATAPATAASTGPAAGAALEADTMTRVDDLLVHTSMDPETPGPDSLLVQVLRLAPATDRAVTGVQVTLRQPGRQPQTVSGRQAGGGRFEFPRVRIAAAGRLDVAVAIARSDGTLETATCVWQVGPRPPVPPAGLPETPWAPLLNTVALVLALLLAGGVAARVVAARRRRAPARA